jgi:hypothetical protein
MESLRSEEDLRKISEGARRRAQQFDASKIALKLVDYYTRIRKRWQEGKVNG